MIFPKYIKHSILSAVAFFVTLITLSTGYSLYISSYPATAWNGSTISSNEWNKIVSNLQTLDANLSAFTISSGNVWIGTSPSERFDISGGNIKMWWEHIVTSCSNCTYVTATCTSGKRVIWGGCEPAGGWSIVYAVPRDGDYWCSTQSAVPTIVAHVYCANIR